MAQQTRAKIIFFGSPEFAAVSLRALLNDARFDVSLVVTNPDRPAGRGKKEIPTPVKIVAEAAKIPCITPNKISSDLNTFLENAKKYGPFTIGVVVAFGQLLPVEVLSLPEHGCINVHGSLLPRWRGAAPMQRAIMSGDTKTGVQLMQMEQGLDTGAVFATSVALIDDSTTLEDLHDDLSVKGAKLLTDNLMAIINNELTATAQSSEGITYAKKILNDEAKINWNQSSNEILRQIHGLSPYPGAYTYLEGKRVKIFRSALRQKQDSSEIPPGTIIFASSDDLRVATNDGSLALLELQVEGKKRLGTREFLSGVELKAGDKFRE